VDLTLCFGMAGSQNDITVLQHSPVIERLYEGQASECNYEFSDHEYIKG
jgi:hypothetical protein